MNNLISYEKSIEILKQNLKSWDKTEKIEISNSQDRIVANDIIALKNHPQKPTAAMDGYAFKYKDNISTLEVTNDDMPAGIYKNIKIDNNSCIKTFTGSLMCDGTDTLIPIENVEISNKIVKIKKKVSKGFAVRDIGESYKKGEILIPKYTKLGYAQIAILAELGYTDVTVFKKPKVAIISIGSEIKQAGEKLEHEGQVYSSNHIALEMIMQKIGANTSYCKIVKDNKEQIKKAIKESVNDNDFVITTGGVSVGDYDFTRDILRQDYDVIIDKVCVKPGRHIKIAKKEDKLIFALPGFPFSAIVMSLLYVRVVINSYFNQKEPYLKAILDEDYHKKSNLLEFSAANIEYKDGKIFVNLKDKKQGSSAIINNLSKNAVLLVAPQQKQILKKGEIVDILIMV